MKTGNTKPVPATVFVVDDDSAARQSIKALLESARLSVQTHASAKEFLEHYNPSIPGCLVLDLRLPDVSGLQIIRRIREKYQHCPPAIIITGHGDVPTAVAAMKLGVCDFLEKPFLPLRLLEQAQRAIELDQVARQERSRSQQFQHTMARLSERERVVLDGLMHAKPNKQIAAELGLSPKTVATHRANILEKFGVESIIEVVHAPDPASVARDAWARDAYLD